MTYRAVTVPSPHGGMRWAVALAADGEVNLGEWGAKNLEVLQPPKSNPHAQRGAAVYGADELRLTRRLRLPADDPRLVAVRTQWERELREAAQRLPAVGFD
jgi:hypothetical protein